MMIEITDQVGTNGTVIVDNANVADAIRPWFPEAPVEVEVAINDLQDAIDRDDHAQFGLAEFLAITITPVGTVEVR